MRIGILGSGGREHAMAWKVSQSVPPEDVFVLPGNGGTSNNVPVDPHDFVAVERACREHKIDLLLVGPEAPLVAGIVDHFAESDVRAFGPARNAARLEGSKIWAKQFMGRHGVATADFEVVDDPEAADRPIEERGGGLVVKYDGLAAGKGVVVCDDAHDAKQALRALRATYGSSARFLLEERLAGCELSILGITDGRTIRLLSPSRDHKRLLDGDRGPNTGGMGAFCPVPDLDLETLAAVRAAVIEPTLRGLRDERLDYCGFLYFGLMLTGDGPKLLEYNVRLGDPEAEVVLPALETGLVELVESCLDGALDDQTLDFRPGAYVDVVLTSGGYPGDYATGYEIVGLDNTSEDALVFHAGTRRDGGRVLTAGGRVLNVVGRGEDLPAASEAAYAACRRIRFENMTYRMDIGARP